MKKYKSFYEKMLEKNPKIKEHAEKLKKSMVFSIKTTRNIRNSNKGNFRNRKKK